MACGRNLVLAGGKMQVKDINRVGEARKSQVARILSAKSLLRLGLQGKPPFVRLAQSHSVMIIAPVGEVRSPQAEFVKEVLAAPDHWSQSRHSHILKDDRTSLILRLEGPEGPLVLKSYRMRKPIDPVLNRMRFSRAQRSFAAAHAIAQLGFSTPFAWGCSTTLCHRWPLAAHLITDYLDGFPTLAEFMARPARKRHPRWLAKTVRAFASWLARLHDSGIHHPDLKPVNILVQAPTLDDSAPTPNDFILIDLDRVTIRSHLRPQHQLRNLVQLHGSFQADLPWKLRLDFWQHYQADLETPFTASFAELESETLRWLGKRKQW